MKFAAGTHGFPHYAPALHRYDAKFRRRPQRKIDPNPVCNGDGAVRNPHAGITPPPTPACRSMIRYGHAGETSQVGELP